MHRHGRRVQRVGCERTVCVEINERRDEELEKSGCANEQCLDGLSIMDSSVGANAILEKNAQTFADICTKL